MPVLASCKREQKYGKGARSVWSAPLCRMFVPGYFCSAASALSTAYICSSIRVTMVL